MPPVIKEDWHLDKRVPLALVGTILFQTFALGMWAATISGRVAALEQANEARAALAIQDNQIRTQMLERMARIESDGSYTRKTLDEVRTWLQALRAEISSQNRR